MKKETLGTCPVCDKKLNITRLTCNSCGTTMEGEFTQCKFCRLTSKQKNFIEVFIKNRGNIKEIEKEMGISYPTVRNKLENIIRDLGYKPQPTEQISKTEILKKLSDGEITAEQALNMINE